MVKHDLERIVEVIQELGLPYKYHTWISLPDEETAHCFVTYFVPSESFDGHDLRAEYCDYTVNVFIVFQNYKDDTDMETEAAFEEACRWAARFTKTAGYDSDKELYFSQYEFNFKEFFEE